MIPTRLYPILSFIAAIMFLDASSSTASAAQINFDDAPNGTIIDTRYPGVTFGCVVCTSGHAYARDMNTFGSTTAATDPNVLTLISPAESSVTSFNALYGAVTVFFATPQRTVTIMARPQLPLEFLGNAPNRPFLEAYSSTTQNASTFLGRVLYPIAFGTDGYCNPPTSACGGPWQALTFTSSSDNIVSLRLSSQTSQGGPNVYADFDDLTFEATPPPPTSTPEATFCANFDYTSVPLIPAGMTLYGSATVHSNYLKLTDNQESRNGLAVISDFNGGQRVTAFQATFKASLFGAAIPEWPADGFSFSLVPAATAPDLSYPNEEGLNHGLAISFDTFDNGGGEAPAIEVKWLGQSIAKTSFQASQSPSGANELTAARDVVITLDDDGTVDVRYGGTLVINNAQTPYSAATIGVPKWILGARTGALTDNHWIDDLCIHARAGGKACLDFNSGVPSGTTLFGDATVNGGILKLVTLPANLGWGIAYVDDFGGGNFVNGFRATFKAALFGSTFGPADGFSFNLVSANAVLPSPGYGQPAEEGLDEGLAVTFDTWDNGAPDTIGVGVKWRGQFIAEIPFQASQSPSGATDFNSAKRDVVIELKDNGRIDVSYGGTLLINNVSIPYDPTVIGVPKWVLGARIGGANDHHWFDDLCIATLPAAGRQIPGLYNTGVDAAGRALPDDAMDTHYVLRLGGAQAIAATSAGGFPIPPWIGDSTVSAWISPSPDTLAPSAGNAYSYVTTFDLTGFNPATARIVGRWATDNNGLDILINGTSTGQFNTTQFSAWTPFAVTSGFVAGLNELRFVVQNGTPGDPPGSDPSGLRVEMSGTASLDCTVIRTSPRLSIARQGGTVIVSWNGAFILQSASQVTGPWTDFTAGNTVNGQDYSATISASASARFFRLRYQCP